MSIIFYVCAIITVTGALAATFMNNVRGAILALWICGLGVGGLFLSFGAEMLAIVQWIISTLGVLSFVFYAVMFGEYHLRDLRPFKVKLTSAILPMLGGCAFTSLIWVGTRDLKMVAETVPAGQDMAALGKLLTENHLVSLEILGLSLLLAIVGSGVIARTEGSGP